MSTSGKALLTLSHALHNEAENYPEIKFGDTVLRLARGDHELTKGLTNVEGKGGFKKVLGLTDGRAIAIPNLDALELQTIQDAAQYASIWERAIQEEKSMSDQIRGLGLEAQHIEVSNIHVNEAILPVMTMPKFSALLSKGLQIRDNKNRASSCGHSMLFGTPQNVENPARLKSVMQGMLDDVVTIIKNGLSLGTDSINVVIKDTPKTPSHDRSKCDLFDKRNQEVRAFLFDFSSKTSPRDTTGLTLLNTSGAVDSARVRKCAEHYVNRGIIKEMGCCF